jgi:hypothetical protein
LIEVTEVGLEEKEEIWDCRSNSSKNSKSGSTCGYVKQPFYVAFIFVVLKKPNDARLVELVEVLD